MRRWLVSIPVALAVLGLAGCVPGRVPIPVAAPNSHNAVAPSRSPSRSCPSGQLPVSRWLPDKADVSVAVYNGASRTGLATDVAKELTARGFTVRTVQDSDKPAPQTLLRHGPDGLGAAWLLRAYFPDARTDYQASRKGPSVDVIVGTSFVKIPNAPEVNQRIAQNGMPSPPPGTCLAD